MRNNALDLTKLVACGFVVTLHLAGFPGFPEWGAGVSSIMARWAVPFFFLISGYCLANKDAGALFGKIQKIIKMLLFWSFLYLVFIFANNHFSIDAVITQGLGFAFFIRGSFVHLWFLCALVYGCLIMSLFLGKERSAVPSLLALAIVFSYWRFDMLNSTGSRQFPLFCIPLSYGIFML